MKTNPLGRMPYRTRMFVGILAIALLPLCITGAFSYWTYIDELSAQMDATTQSIANQTRDRIATVMSSIIEYYVEVPKNADVEWLSAEMGIPYQRYTEINAAIRHFRGSSSLYEYIIGYTYINRVGDFVISTNGLHPYQTLTNRAAIDALVAPEEPGFYRMRWHNNMKDYGTTSTPRGTIDLRGYLLIMQLPVNGDGADQALIINLDTVNLRRLLVRDMDEYSVVVLDKNREVFLTSSNALAEYCIERYDDLHGLSAPILARVDENEQYRIAVAQSDPHGLMFIVGYDSEIITEGAERILALIWVLALTVLVLVVLSWVGSSWLYRPILQLASFFGGKSEGKRGNEMERITQELTQLVGSHTTMERVIDDQRDMLTQTFMARLFRGELTRAQIDEQARQLRLETAGCFCVLACRLPVGGGAAADSVDENAVRILFLDGLPQDILSALYVPPVNDRNAIVLLLRAEGDDALAAKAEAVHRALAEYAAKELAITLYTGVSTRIDSIALCRAAFLESVEALKSDALDDTQAGGAIYYYTDIRADKAAGGATYESLEQEIRTAIDECNRAKAERCLMEFIGRLPGWVNARHERALRIHRFVTIILSVLHDAGLSLDEVFADSEHTLYRQVGMLYNDDELQRFLLTGVIVPSIHALEVFREGASPMNRIAALVEETSGNITIAECADALGYHTSYIWRILKTHTGASFAEYTAQAKIAAAKRMLEETELSVAEIATALSYTNAQNFIRFFSKHTGTTPGKYRQAHRQQEEK